MNRREFIRTLGGALLAVPAVLSLKACGSDNASSSSDGFDEVSSVDAGHTHNVRVVNSDLTNPPAGGVQYTSTNVNSHVHTIVLTQADLVAINGGGQVTVTSSGDGGHTHTWIIQKP